MKTQHQQQFGRLNESQRAMIAAKIATMRQGERTDLLHCSNLNNVSQSDAANQLQVSRHSVVNASKVVKEPYARSGRFDLE